MKKLVIFSILVLGILVLPACDFFKTNVDQTTKDTISSQIETNVLAAFQANPSGLVAASTTKKPWDGNYSISGSVICKYNTSEIPPTTIPISATPITVSNNTILDSSLKKQPTVDSKGKATANGSVTDENGVKTVVKIVYQFSKTGVTGKTTMTITIPTADGKIITAKCTGTLTGKKQK